MTLQNHPWDSNQRYKIKKIVAHIHQLFYSFFPPFIYKSHAHNNKKEMYISIILISVALFFSSTGVSCETHMFPKDLRDSFRPTYPPMEKPQSRDRVHIAGEYGSMIEMGMDGLYGEEFNMMREGLREKMMQSMEDPSVDCSYTIKVEVFTLIAEGVYTIYPTQLCHPKFEYFIREFKKWGVSFNQVGNDCTFETRWSVAFPEQFIRSIPYVAEIVKHEGSVYTYRQK